MVVLFQGTDSTSCYGWSVCPLPSNMPSGSWWVRVGTGYGTGIAPVSRLDRGWM